MPHILNRCILRGQQVGCISGASPPNMGMKKSNDHETMILSEGNFVIKVRDREGVQSSHFQDLKAGVQNRLYRLS